MTYAYRTASLGNAAMVAIAFTMMFLLVVTGGALSMVSNQESRRLISSEGQQQLYYVTQAGIQEALATRFYPRTNRLTMQYENLPAPGTVPLADEPYFRFSGRVESTPLTGNPQSMGMYRYIIFGGDPAREADTGAYTNEYTQLVAHEDVIEQDFYVVSRGAVCVNDSNEHLTDVIQLDNSQPVCPVGKMRELTLVSEFEVSRPDPNNPNTTVNRLIRTRNLGEIPRDQTITLGNPVQLADGTIGNQFNFETEWFRQDSYAHLERAMFYPTQNPEQNSGNWRTLMSIVPGKNTGPTNVRPDEAIRLYFRGSVDDRSIYGYNATQCKDPLQAWKCHVRVEKLKANGDPEMDPATGKPKVYTNSALMPLYPGVTQLVVYPPSDFSDGLEGNARYRLVVDPFIQDTFGNESGVQYELEFSVVPIN